METCTSCGAGVTGKKFCPHCGTAVQSPSTAPGTCPRCGGEVSPSAAFCMHCGAALRSQTAPQPTTRTCPVCQTVLSAQTAFCTNCGHNMNEAAASAQTPYRPSPHQPSQYGQPQYAQYSQYPQSQSPQDVQPQYSQYPQSQYQQTYDPYAQGSGGYQPQPMMGQGPMVLRCPTCMAMAPVGTPACLSCHTSLAGVVPTPANVQNQQGGFLQGNGGNLAMGALGGAAAVIGGEMLLRGLENAVEGDVGYGEYEHHRHHHHRDEGLLGDLGELGKDIGLF
jgi:ssDNA-binding Zn-finger/Zn-ribbon topoisomerase 1